MEEEHLHLDPYATPERYANLVVNTVGVDYAPGTGILQKVGDDRGRVREPTPNPHKEAMLRFAEKWREEIYQLSQKLEIFRNAAPPPAASILQTLNRLDGFIIELKYGKLTRSELLSHLAPDPDLNWIMAVLWDTGESPVDSVFDIPAWSEQQRREIEDRNFKANLERNIARKKARDEEKARKEELEKKRKQLEQDLGLNLGSLPRGTG